MPHSFFFYTLVIVLAHCIAFAQSPSISTLNPSSVPQGWEGVVSFQGDGFDKDSFPLFDGAVPKVSYKNETLLEAEIGKAITESSGIKKVKVHTGSGAVSNEREFEVK